MKRCASALLAIAGLGVATPSAAADIIYTVSGTGSGTLNGQSFSGNFSITTSGDTATRQQCSNPSGPVAGCYFVVNTNAVVNIAALGQFTLTNPGISFVNNAGNLFGFSEIVPPTFAVNSFAFVLAAPATTFATWDGMSTLAPFATTLQLNKLFRPQVDTNGGSLVFASPTQVSSAIFSARLAASVPEPATWITFILGFGTIGFAVRRRKFLAPARA